VLGSSHDSVLQIWCETKNKSCNCRRSLGKAGALVAHTKGVKMAKDDLDNLDHLLEELDQQIDADQAPVGGLAARLADLDKQGAQMKSLLESDDEPDDDDGGGNDCEGGGAGGAHTTEAGIDALLGEAGKLIAAGAVTTEGLRYDPDHEASSASSSTATSRRGAVETSLPSSLDEDAYADGFESEGEFEATTDAKSESAAGADAGVLMHQMHQGAAAAHTSGDDGYDDDEFDDDDAVLSIGAASSRGGVDDATQMNPEWHAVAPSHAPAHARASAPAPPTSSEMIAHQLSLLQEDWMKEGSMQQRIYHVAVEVLAKSILTDLFDYCIDAYDARKTREDSINAERRRRMEAGFQQVCVFSLDLRVCRSLFV